MAGLRQRSSQATTVECAREAAATATVGAPAVESTQTSFRPQPLDAADFTRRAAHALLARPMSHLLLLNEDGHDERAVVGPTQVRQLQREFPKLKLLIESSQTRCFADDEYRDAGATIVHRRAGDILVDDNHQRVPAADVVLSTKQPYGRLVPGARQFAFYHVHKGQDPHLLRALLAVDRHRHGTVVSSPFSHAAVDYELLVNDRGRRVLQFGSWAGRVGMINALAALAAMVPESPFAGIKQARDFGSYSKVVQAMAQVASRVRTVGLKRPWIIGVVGNGEVSRGAQEVIDGLWESGEYESLSPAELLLRANAGALKNKIYKVVFSRGDRYIAAGQLGRAGRPFNAEHYERYPDQYASRMAEYVMHLDVLVNGVYWEPRLPRLLTARDLYRIGRTGQRLVIADITCDRKGSLPTPEITSDSERPFLLWNAVAGSMAGWTNIQGPSDVGPGQIPILAHDRLPRELARDASETFAAGLLPFLMSFGRGGAGSEAERQKALVRATLSVGCTPSPHLSAAVG